MNNIYYVFTIFSPGTFAIVSTMVGEVCDREISKYNFVSTENSSNMSTNTESSPEDIKLEIAVALTLLVGIIQVWKLVHI